MRTLGPLAPGESEGETIGTVSVRLTATQPFAGRERTVTCAVCAERASTRWGPTTVPALAGCSVETTRTLPPTIGSPRSDTVRTGLTRVWAEALTPPAVATQGRAESTRTRSLPWSPNRRPRSITGRRGTTLARSTTYWAYRATRGADRRSAIDVTGRPGSAPASVCSAGCHRPGRKVWVTVRPTAVAPSPRFQE